MHIIYGHEREHAEQLKRGLVVLGPKFLAQICWWCKGTGRYKFEGHCDVCGKGRFYGAALGLLIGNEPAPESVVNQVLVAAPPNPETGTGELLENRDE